jgi:hypothetical protein
MSSNGIPLLSGPKSGLFAHSNLLQRSETFSALNVRTKKANVDDLDRIAMNYNIKMKTDDLKK